MVSPQAVFTIFLTMQSYKFYQHTPVDDTHSVASATASRGQFHRAVKAEQKLPSLKNVLSRFLKRVVCFILLGKNIGRVKVQDLYALLTI